MSAHPSHQSKSIVRRLSWRLFGILSVTLQSGVAGWIITRKAIRRREKIREFSGMIVGFQISVQRFTIETDLALVALASSDWSMLVEHRMESERVREKIGKILLDTHLKSKEGPLARYRSHFDQLGPQWSELDRAATLALRYDQNELRGNPRLLEVDHASRQILHRLEKIYFQVSEDTARGLTQLERLQKLSLALNVSVVLSTMAYSSRQFIRPLVRAFIDLESYREKLSSQQTKMIQSAKLAALGEMAAGIAHEINNPLGIIKSQAEVMNLLASKGHLSIERSLKAFNSIDNTVDRIAGIVKGLRNIARLEEGMPYREVSLSSILDDLLSVCSQRFLHRGIDLRVGSVPSTLMLECRPGQILQVLLNLLSNAYDAIAELHEKWVQIDIVDRGEDVEISVTDSGRGIPAPIADKIMQPFFTTKEPGKGTGIGLSIAQTIVGEHHGSLELDSTNQNTCFILRLPKRQSPPIIHQVAA